MLSRVLTEVKRLCISIISINFLQYADNFIILAVTLNALQSLYIIFLQAHLKTKKELTAD